MTKPLHQPDWLDEMRRTSHRRSSFLARRLVGWRAYLLEVIPPPIKPRVNRWRTCSARRQ